MGDLSPGVEHHRKLERLYLRARTNVYYRPQISVSEGRASISLAVREDFFHAASAVHGSVYFKVLDDAAFFAVNSTVGDVLVLTTSFHVTFLRPVHSGRIIARGKFVHASRRLLLGESEAWNDEGKLIARGSGIFMRSHIPLGPDLGYA